jgi:SOS response regulatory protein OraA/RecX
MSPTINDKEKIKNYLLSLEKEGEESARFEADGAVLRRDNKLNTGDANSLGESSDKDSTLDMARKKALNILSYADNNKKNLLTKLLRAGFSYDVSSRVCEEMVELGYIDERRQLERLVSVEANQRLRGPYRIIPTLVAKGYSKDMICDVVRELTSSGEVDFEKNARSLIEKKLPSGSIEERRKLLYKNGFKK